MMATFVLLHTNQDQEIAVNLDCISMMEPEKDFTRLHLVDGESTLVVSETLSEILMKGCFTRGGGN
jgi:hypothetical protein